MVLSCFDRFPDCTAAVIGDIMIDIYLHGDVSRISPEAPVPVIRWQSESASPGGAANVAANIAALGARAILIGLAGDDLEGRESLIRLCERSGRVDVSGIVRDPSRPTIRKMRVMGHRQQIARIDREGTHAADEWIEDALIAKSIEAIDACDVVILSDYGKGALTDRVLAETIGYARAKRKPVIVDPKRRDFAAYSGASIITPNRQELTLATGLKCDSDLEAAAAAAAAHAACGADVLLTRSERGMSFFPLDGTPLHLPAVRRDVFDVSGAGDTVVAVLATALAAKLPIAEAIKASNYAAGIVVGRSGTATLTREELIAAFSTTLVEDKPDGRLVDLEEAKLLRRLWQNQGFTVGIANGCFDIIHPGHISLIRQATQACDRLIMALNTDASVRRLKGQTRPAQKEVARAEVIGAIKGVALVVLFNEDTPYNLISALQPDVLIKGADYTEDQVAGADIVRARGGKILLAELTEGHSTTRLLEAAQ